MRSVMRRGIIELSVLALLTVTGAIWLTLAYAGHRSALFDVEALPVMLPTAGLHAIEPLADRPGSFRWTKGEGVLRPPNPGGPLALRLTLSSGLETFTPVELIVGRSTQRFLVGPGLRAYHALLPAQVGERVTVVIRSSTREIKGRTIGVVVQRIQIAGDGPAPPMLLAALWLATIGGYGLFRRAGMSIPLATATTLGLQGLVSLWQALGAWRYGFMGGLLTLSGGSALGALLIERLWPPVPATPLPAPEWKRRDNVILAGLFALAVAVCLPWFGAPDPVGDLELVARRMGFMMEDGLAAAFTYGADFMPFYLFVIWLSAPLVPLFNGAYYDPVPTVTHVIIKTPTLIPLLITVGLIYRWARRFGGSGRAALLAGLYAVAPPVWINLAWWGQIDVLLALPMILTVLWLDRWRGRASWLCWGGGMMIKLHAVLLAPLLYAGALRRYGPRGLAEGGFLALGIIAVASAPFVLIGEGPGLYQAALGSLERFPKATNRAYNLWWLVTGGQTVSDLTEWAGISYRTIGFLLISIVALLVMLAVLRSPGAPTRVVGAAILSLAFFSLPTQIHERYIFFTMPFLLLAAATDLRLLIPFLLIVATSTINLFGAIGGFSPALTSAIHAGPWREMAAWVNLATLAALLVYLFIGPHNTKPDRLAR